MNEWEKLLNTKRPDACKKTGICCSTAVSVKPWVNICKAKYDKDFREFFNVFIPYENHEKVKKLFPNAYEECLNVAKTRKDISLDDIYFYHCRFINEQNHCLVYEDRPSFCREFPASLFDTIPRECGYYNWMMSCRKKFFDLQLELKTIQMKQYSSCSFYVLSPAKSFLFYT